MILNEVDRAFKKLNMITIISIVKIKGKHDHTIARWCLGK